MLDRFKVVIAKVLGLSSYNNYYFECIDTRERMSVRAIRGSLFTTTDISVYLDINKTYYLQLVYLDEYKNWYIYNYVEYEDEKDIG